MASKGSGGYKCRIALVLLLFFGSTTALNADAVIQRRWSFTSNSTEYGIVLDAGSSRTNVFLYEWPGEKENDTGIVKEVKNCRVKEKAITEMTGDPEEDEAILSAFTDCIDDIKGAIPAEKQNRTPLFLGATAGMRLLEKSNQTRANDVMSSLRKFLSAQPFDFQNATIISGQEEGLYRWITVNYIMENFIEKNLWNKSMTPEGGKTVGSMDLGGASTQIAFAVADNLTGEDYLRVQLYGYQYNVYTHSFLCYGKNESEKKVLDRIVQKSSNPNLILNPCYARGLNLTLKASQIYNTPCTEMPSRYNPDQEFFMLGTGDSDGCREYVKTIFDFDTCHADQCSFNGVEQPAVVGEFMAYAGFFFTSRALGGKQDLDSFRAAITTFCNTSWSQLKIEKSWISERFLKTYCSAGHYINLLLTEGYKFSKETWPNIHFEQAIKDTSIGWSLGYVVSLSNTTPPNGKENFPMTNPVSAGLVLRVAAFIILTFVVVFIFTCYRADGPA